MADRLHCPRESCGQSFTRKGTYQAHLKTCLGSPPNHHGFPEAHKRKRGSPWSEDDEGDESVEVDGDIEVGHEEHEQDDNEEDQGEEEEDEATEEDPDYGRRRKGKGKSARMGKEDQMNRKMSKKRRSSRVMMSEINGKNRAAMKTAEPAIFACTKAGCARSYNSWNELSQHLKICGALPCPCGYVLNRSSDFFKHQRSCKFYEVSKEDRQLLFKAVLEGDVEVIRRLTNGREHLVNLFEESTLSTLLHLACLNGHLPLVRWMVQQRFLVPNLSNKDGKTPCYIVCELGNAAILSELLVHLAHILDTSIGSQHFSPLMIACKHGHVEIVRALLDFQGKDFVTHRAYYSSPLSCACDSGKPEVLDLLLSRPKVDVNEKLHLGGTVLHHACLNNQKEAVRRLLQVPTLDVNMQTDFGMTPLLTCCQNKKYVIAMELLRDPRVDPNITDSRGRTALWMAASGESPSIFTAILVLSRYEVDTYTTPDNSSYSPKLMKLILEYHANRSAFFRKYGREFFSSEEEFEEMADKIPQKASSLSPESSVPLTPSSFASRSGSETPSDQVVVDLEHGGIESDLNSGDPESTFSTKEDNKRPAKILGSRRTRTPGPETRKEGTPSSAPLPSSMLSLLFVVENLRNGSLPTDDTTPQQMMSGQESCHRHQ